MDSNYDFATWWAATYPSLQAVLDRWSIRKTSIAVNRVAKAFMWPRRRHYHTAGHAEWCLNFLFTMPGLVVECDEVTVVERALAMHDLHYQPGASDNEAQSAKSATDLGASSRVCEIILATGRHLHDSPGVVSADTAVVLDVDLAILSEPWDVYVRDYAMPIAAEWSFLDREEYARGRLAVCHRLLARHALYLTDAMRCRRDAARRNLRDEAELWKQYLAYPSGADNAQNDSVSGRLPRPWRDDYEIAAFGAPFDAPS